MTCISLVFLAGFPLASTKVDFAPTPLADAISRAFPEVGSESAAAPRLIADKLDDELLEGAEFRPVLVRFEDQLLPNRDSYDRFARESEDRNRADLRKEVLAKLRSKSDASWKAVAPLMRELEDKGLLRQTTRFWIVNGFAADAKPDACRQLSARSDVAFVYLQRSPGNFRQNQPVRSESPTSGPRWDATLKVAEREKSKSAPKPDERPEYSWNLKRIKAEEAWKEGARGQGIVVAINDGGMDDVPALRDAYWRNPKETLNGKDDDGNGYVDDLFGYDFQARSGLTFGASGVFHGTMCAGIVAGRQVAGQPLRTGVAPEAKLMLLNGMGSLKSFEYALANGADIVSMSWMWPNIELGNYRGVFRLALEHLSAGGVLPVGGAGNFATSAPAGKQICLPKDIPCCVSVAGILADGKRPAFSSMGPVSWKGVKFYDDYPELHKPDVTAPNGDYPVWATTEGLPSPNWRVVWKGAEGGALIEGPRGNSFAGPHAAGVAALMLSANPDLKPWQTKRILEETSEDLEAPGWDKESGAGLLNAHRAVLKARATRG